MWRQAGSTINVYWSSTFKRQHPSAANNIPGFPNFPAYWCNPSGNASWHHPFKLDSRQQRSDKSFQQTECRVTNIQYLLIRSPRLLLFSVNTQSSLISFFLLLHVLCHPISHPRSLLNLHTSHAHLSPSSSSSDTPPPPPSPPPPPPPPCCFLLWIKFGVCSFVQPSDPGIEFVAFIKTTHSIKPV